MVVIDNQINSINDLSCEKLKRAILAIQSVFGECVWRREMQPQNELSNTEKPQKEYFRVNN